MPMAEPIKCFTGILEIRSIINFVRNSKFDVSKFFGFELEELSENCDLSLSQQEVVESLQNYEIEFSDNYVLNAVRVDKKGNVSLQKLNEMYAVWQKMVDGIRNMNFEEEGDMEEQDEEFEANETEGVENSCKDEEFEDDDFDD